MRRIRGGGKAGMMSRGGGRVGLMKCRGEGRVGRVR